MWYAVTANPLNRNKKESKKEYYAKECVIFLSADSKEELEEKLKLTIKNFPKESKKYVEAGLKLVEASSTQKAKRIAAKTSVYIEKDGQFKFF